MTAVERSWAPLQRRPSAVRTILIVALLLGAGCSESGVPSTGVAEISTPAATPGDDWKAARLLMVEETIIRRGVSDPAVVRAMQTVPRHLFVPHEFRDQAYDDHPLPIGYGQTISQPYIVAWMTELLALQEGNRVLEVGTGSGYQAAVLAELGFVDVYSIEIIPELAESARALLSDLGYGSVQVSQGDGYYGLPDEAPFDAIIVTAAPDHLPGPLGEQLAEGGRLVIPIGPPGGYQSLWLFSKDGGELSARNLGGVSFVPLLGAGAASPTPVP